MPSRTSVKLINAAIDEVAIKGNGKEIVVRGVIDNDSLDLLQVAPYQREILPQSKLADLAEAMQHGRVPDIELGMRGGNFREGEEAFYLQDATFIIDGLQRVTAAKRLLQQIKDGNQELAEPHLGATVFFNTTEAWERERFRILNSLRVKLSANVLLRNRIHDFLAVETIHQMSTAERSFVMHGRICWSQKMNRGEFISAQTYVRTIGYLFSHLGGTRTSKTSALLPNMQRIMEQVGRNIFRDDIKTFFDIIDQAYGIRMVTYKDNAAYLRHGFLAALATVFSNHTNFWRGHRLYVEPRLIYKLKLFGLADPNIRDMCSAGGQGTKLLYRLLVDHLNSGRRSGRLVERVRLHDLEDEDLSAEEEEVSA